MTPHVDAGVRLPHWMYRLTSTLASRLVYSTAPVPSTRLSLATTRCSLFSLLCNTIVIIVALLSRSPSSKARIIHPLEHARRPTCALRSLGVQQSHLHPIPTIPNHPTRIPSSHLTLPSHLSVSLAGLGPCSAFLSDRSEFTSISRVLSPSYVLLHASRPAPRRPWPWLWPPAYPLFFLYLLLLVVIALVSSRCAALHYRYLLASIIPAFILIFIHARIRSVARARAYSSRTDRRCRLSTLSSAFAPSLGGVQPREGRSARAHARTPDFVYRRSSPLPSSRITVQLPLRPLSVRLIVHVHVTACTVLGAVSVLFCLSRGRPASRGLPSAPVLFNLVRSECIQDGLESPRKNLELAPERKFAVGCVPCAPVLYISYPLEVWSGYDKGSRAKPLRTPDAEAHEHRTLAAASCSNKELRRAIERARSRPARAVHVSARKPPALRPPPSRPRHFSAAGKRKGKRKRERPAQLDARAHRGLAAAQRGLQMEAEKQRKRVRCCTSCIDDGWKVGNWVCPPRLRLDGCACRSPRAGSS
ncbi:hypothetical protein PYCCODRAFT_163375 [Trametes coccinea BRFM310]|uniref:Uncharacterized protein n=1 Tax=Trametes coccinea (strain BRFM310) TaxID=1353009 RepID=A0A1Y2IS23_TRAC3|nr:hypothetical protein PYCCODRAFT_163375 [Trametes coccinea BRFM310]